MACRSASVQRAQKKSKEALTAIKRLEKSMEDLSTLEKKDFETKVSASQAKLGVDDFKRMGGDFATRVDFTHEFNADALIPVITNVLNAAAISISGTGAASVLTNPQNIKIYAELLSSIAEAIKTKASTGANTSYSVSRLAPGFFSFTSTKSKTISDKETFGEESVTATTFQYALYFSQKHAVESNTWTTVLLILEAIRKLNEARVGLVDRLVSSDISIAEFTKLSDTYKEKIEDFESQLSNLVDEVSVVGVVEKATRGNINDLESVDILYSDHETNKVLSRAIGVLGTRGSLYSPALRETRDLLNMVKSQSQNLVR